MKPIAIRICTVADMERAPNLADLLAEYGAESSIDDLGPPNMQIETYRQMEAVGALQLLGAFQGDNLVGLLIFVASINPHYGKALAVTESFFVARSARKSGAGMALLREAERIATDMGVVGFFVSAPNGSKLATVLDRHKAYRETNRVFFRGLQ